MPHAKFGLGLLKFVAVHKEEKTGMQTHTCALYPLSGGIMYSGCPFICAYGQFATVLP